MDYLKMRVKIPTGLVCCYLNQRCGLQSASSQRLPERVRRSYSLLETKSTCDDKEGTHYWELRLLHTENDEKNYLLRINRCYLGVNGGVRSRVTESKYGLWVTEGRYSLGSI